VLQAWRFGYDIVLQQAPPLQRFVRFAFAAKHQGREVGRLEVDCIGDEKRLYVQNIFVAAAHRRRGVGAALIMAATKTTNCAVVTTSGRTGDGASFFEEMRPRLKRCNAELRDNLCQRVRS